MIEFTVSIKVMQAHDKLEEAELTEQRVSLHYTDYAEKFRWTKEEKKQRENGKGWTKEM